MSIVTVDSSLCLTKKVCQHCFAAEQCRYSNIGNNIAGMAYVIDPQVCVACLDRHQFCSAKAGCSAAKASVAQHRAVDNLSPAIVVA